MCINLYIRGDNEPLIRVAPIAHLPLQKMNSTISLPHLAILLIKNNIY